MPRPRCCRASKWPEPSPDDRDEGSSMGKMFDALKHVNGLPAAEKKPLFPKENPAKEETHVEAPDSDDFPYIEVGGPGKKVDGSPTVLGATPAGPAKTAAVQKNSASLGATLAELPPLGVNLEAWPGAAQTRAIARDILAFHQPDHP